jgi:hypothetical protein
MVAPGLLLYFLDIETLQEAITQSEVQEESHEDMLGFDLRGPGKPSLTT